MKPRLKKSLLRRPRPYQDEILASYIVRLAQENFYHCHWLIELAGFKASKKIHEINLLDQADDLSLLSHITGTSTKVLKSMAFSKVEEDDKYLQLSSTFNLPRRSIQFKELCVCTQCLLEAPYIRKVWSFIPIKVCPLHSVHLINKCSNCNDSLYWNIYFVSSEKNMVTTCKSCGFDLREWLPSSIIFNDKTTISTDEIVLSKFIDYIWILLLRTSDYNKSLSRNYSVLNLESEDMYLIIAFFITEFLVSSPFKFEIQLNLSNVDIQDLTSYGFFLFKGLSLNNYYFLVKWSNYEYSPCSKKLAGVRVQIEIRRLKDSRSGKLKRSRERGISVWRSFRGNQIHFLC